MTLITQIDDAIRILKNYQPRPLIYSIPDFNKHISIYKNYQPRCSFCKYLLVSCDNCLPKTEHYSLLNKFRTYCEKKQKNVKLIDVWIKNLGWTLFDDGAFDGDVDTEIIEWKSLNNDGSIVDFLYHLKPNKNLYKEAISIIDTYVSSQPNENDLDCFIMWIFMEKEEYVKNIYRGYLDEWVKALHADRELCNYYDSLKNKNYNDVQLTKLLTNTRGFGRVIIQYNNNNNKDAAKEFMNDKTSTYLIVKL